MCPAAHGCPTLFLRRLRAALSRTECSSATSSGSGPPRCESALHHIFHCHSLVFPPSKAWALLRQADKLDGSGSVEYDEYICYKKNQAKIRYIVTVKFGQKV